MVCPLRLDCAKRSPPIKLDTSLNIHLQNNSRGPFERNQFLRRSESIHVFQKVENDRSSLAILGCKSSTLDSMSHSSVEFDFDHEISFTEVYRNVFRSRQRGNAYTSPEIGVSEILETTVPLFSQDEKIASVSTSQPPMKQPGANALSIQNAEAIDHLPSISRISSFEDIIVQTSRPSWTTPSPLQDENVTSCIEPPLERIEANVTSEYPPTSYILPSILRTVSFGDITVNKSYAIDYATAVSVSTSSIDDAIPPIDNTTTSSKLSDIEWLRSGKRAWARHIPIPDKIRGLANSNKRSTEDLKLQNVILLGCSNSGKTTLKKSIDFLCRDITMEETKAYAGAIQTNIVRYMLCILYEMQKKRVPSLWAQRYGLYDIGRFPYHGWPYEYSPDTEHSLVTSSWEDPEFRETFDDWSYDLAAKEAAAQLVVLITRLEVPLLKLRSFFRSIHRIWDSEYKPTKEDILRSFSKTRNVTTTNIMRDNKRTKIYDGGGVRVYRKSWANVKLKKGPVTVVYTFSMSDFHQPLFEDPDTTQISEALWLFENMCRDRLRPMTKSILLFTKLDKFITNLEFPAFQAEFMSHFPKFSGDFKNIQHIQECFQQRFMDIVEKHELRKQFVVLFGNLLDPTMKTTRAVLDILFDR